MLYCKSLSEAEPVFKALSAPMRLRIMELIYENDNLSMNDLAEKLGLTNSAISLHVSKLIEAGLVRIQTSSGKRGVMKLVRPAFSKLIVDMEAGESIKQRPFYQDALRIGHFTAIDPHPTCGLATSDSIIGELDDPKVFSYPERFDADILWIGYGFVTYNLPNRLKAGQTISELQISFEISSECPGINEDYPSDIYFEINGIPLGKWISPGDYGARAGMLCPSWWSEHLNQYGLLKTLVINREGTFMDGTSMLSNVTLEQLHLDYNSTIQFTLSVPSDTTNCGGMTLFGDTFGDYNQSILVKTFYTES